jgi:DNA-binding transcriptional LysR family regulator
MLDAHQLNVFLTAAETLNFTRAARELNMTQPSVSQHVQELERHFGTALFDRSGRKVSLTDAGAALLPLAREIVTLSIRIDERMQSLKGEVFGHLIVGCTTTPGRYILPGLLATFLQHHPKVEATCYVSSRQRAVELLCKGQLHLTLASARDFSRDVEFQRFMSDPVVLIAPLDHPWALRSAIEPEDLLRADFILREDGSGTRATVAEGLAALDLSIDRLRTVITLGSSEAIALAVQEGIGVAFVSLTVVERLVPGQVAPVLVHGLDLAQDIYIGRYPRRPATAAQAAFWDFVVDPDNLALRPFRADRRLRLAGTLPIAVPEEIA